MRRKKIPRAADGRLITAKTKDPTEIAIQMRSTATEIAIKTANTARIATTAGTTKGTRSMTVGKAMTGNGIVATVMTTATGETTNPIPVTVATAAAAPTTEPDKPQLARNAKHQENQTSPKSNTLIVGCIVCQLLGKSIGLKCTGSLTSGIANLVKAHGAHPLNKIAYWMARLEVQLD